MYTNETELIEACIAGTPDAWLQFKEQYRRLIRATAARLTRADESTIDDLEATVYQKILEDRCRRLRAWQGRAKFSTYLVQVSRNLMLDWLAKERRQPSALPIESARTAVADTPDIAGNEYRDVQVAALLSAIKTLPERQAIIIQLRLEGRSLRDIAAFLHRPVGTVSVENSRALLRLKKQLVPQGMC